MSAGLARRLQHLEGVLAAELDLAPLLHDLATVTDAVLSRAEACESDADAAAVLAGAPFCADDVERLIAVYEFVAGPPEREWSAVPAAEAAFVRDLHRRCCGGAA